MIDAQAVSSHLQLLESLAQGEAGHQDLAGSAWLEDYLAEVPAEHTRDREGNHWLTLRGEGDRAVVLGSYLGAASSPAPLDSLFGIVTGLETLKALTLRFRPQLPCTVQLVIWAQPGAPAANANTGSYAPPSAAAYLEVHLESGTQLQQAGAPLGVASETSGDQPTVFHPNLSALCDEAIRELTGTSASLRAEAVPHATGMLQQGIPTAILYVQHPAETTGGEASRSTRLHLLQAAEAFGRWAESTVHAVTGDQVDLWAREHRTPHTS